MVPRNVTLDRMAFLGLLMVLATSGLPAGAAAQDNVAAWRVECAGDGKTLDCRAIQQMINREDKQVVVVVSARIAPDTKLPVLTIQLPLGISLVEPIQFKVDNGAVERQPVQTCTNVGCIVTIPLKDPLLTALRNGTLLKIAIQDTNKRTINIDVPLLGFSLAFDKIK
ncbi:MAG: invasion associated locus B family protein [Reyranella sp.]|uniref:invasion associated locus B family protein n=1 Tax=Reyranella sp. TaxID=1929291 RepID=UPI003D0D9F05